MDPQTTLSELLDAVADRDGDRVNELSQALLGWIQNCGLPPRTLGAKQFGRGWHRTVATFVCHLAAGEARSARKRRRGKGNA